MRTLRDWTAKRAGASMKLYGFDLELNKLVRIPHVVTIKGVATAARMVVVVAECKSPKHTIHLV